MRRLTRAHETPSGASTPIVLGLSDAFGPGDEGRVEEVLGDLRELSLDQGLATRRAFWSS